MNARASLPQTTVPHAYVVRGLCAELDGRMVLHGLDMTIHAGRWTAVVGPNGAGKSTLLKCMAGLIPCTGDRELLGEPLQAYAHRDRARRMVWLGQSETAADDLVVRDVVMLGRLPHQPWLAAASDADQSAVEQALADVGMTWAAHKPLGHLSGGERQRVLLARALATQGQVLLMDEPLSHLDPPHQADWLALVRGLVTKGVTVVSVLHELNMALHADELLVLRDGRITHHGASGDAATHAALQAAFDQRVRVHQVAGQWVVLPV